MDSRTGRSAAVGGRGPGWRVGRLDAWLRAPPRQVGVLRLQCGAARGTDGARGRHRHSPVGLCAAWHSVPAPGFRRQGRDQGAACTGPQDKAGGGQHDHACKAGRAPDDFQVPLPKPVDSLCKADGEGLDFAGGGGGLGWTFGNGTVGLPPLDLRARRPPPRLCQHCHDPDQGVAPTWTRRARTSRTACGRCAGGRGLAHSWQLVAHPAGRLRDRGDEFDGVSGALARGLEAGALEAGHQDGWGPGSHGDSTAEAAQKFCSGGPGGRGGH